MRISILKCWGTLSFCGSFCNVHVFTDKEEARIKMREFFKSDIDEYEDDFTEIYVKTPDRVKFHCGDDYYYYEVEEHEL